MTLFHTSELKDPTARGLHAAWFELCDRDMKVLMPPAVAEQLTPLTNAGVPAGMNLAAALLDNHRARGDTRPRPQLEEEAWWTGMWLRNDTPYEIERLTERENAKAAKLLEEVDPRCFPATPPDDIRASADARIVCETIALESLLYVTTDMREIDLVEVNRWAKECGHLRSVNDKRMLYDADITMTEWTYSPEGLEHWVQAGLLACWPPDDGAPAVSVLRNTRRRIGEMVRAGTLPAAGQRLLNGLNTHPDPLGLVEQVRKRLPSATVDVERLHPRHHAGPPSPRQPPAPQTPRGHETRETNPREHDGD